MAFVSGFGATGLSGTTKAKARVSCRRVPVMTTSLAHDITMDHLTDRRATQSNISRETMDAVISAAYKQLFGNAYVMESERAELAVAESQLRRGNLSVKEFVRAVAHSATYRRRFFDACPPYRAVELNFKHLLGRAPGSPEEVSEHANMIATRGFDADVDAHLDSMEYADAFGDDTVPGRVFKGTYPSLEEFTGTAALFAEAGRSDKSLTGRAADVRLGNPNYVLSLEGAGRTSVVAGQPIPSGETVAKGLPARPGMEAGSYAGDMDPKVAMVAAIAVAGLAGLIGLNIAGGS